MTDRRAFPNALPIAVALLCSNAFYPYAVSAQGLYNGSSLFVGVSLHVDGDVTNDGAIVNDANIEFSRDWSCPGQYSGIGSLKAEGESTQRIAHFGHDVFTFIVDGWGPKYVEGKMFVTNNLYLKKGIVEVSALDELAVSDGGVVSGGSRDSYVDGPLTAEGTGYRFFPIGKNGKYAPLEFLHVKGQSSRYSVEVFEDGPAVSIDNEIVRSPLYWQRRDLSGTFGGSSIAVGFDPVLFANPEKIAMIAGTDWDTPFTLVAGARQSSNEDKFVAHTNLTTPIIALGETSEGWEGADLYLPTALSPNASHAENRMLRIFGDRLSPDQFHLTVFNRWGAVVFETRSLDDMADNGWDGRSPAGNALTAGAYPYRLTALDKTGGKVEKQGVITIIY
jgi:hypothetical protein